MGRLVDMFGEGQGGLEFVMEHTWLCGLVVLAGGAATFCRLYLIETAIERIAFRLRREFFSALIRRWAKWWAKWGGCAVEKAGKDA